MRGSPNLGRLRDISEFVARDGAVSDSEAEENPENKLRLPQNLAGRGNAAAQRSAIRLKEIGPRLTLQLLKIEEGLSGGAAPLPRVPNTDRCRDPSAEEEKATRDSASQGAARPATGERRGQACGASREGTSKPSRGGTSR